MKSYLPKDDRQLEVAIHFLTRALERSSHNPKPVLLHSIKVGIHLYQLGYDKEIVTAAFLHDLLEDTDTQASEITEQFGSAVAEYVLALTLDTKVRDKTARYKDSIQRCRLAGPPALIIRAADLYDNASYYHLAQSEALEEWLLKKLQSFVDSTSDILGEEIIYHKLLEKLAAIQS
jgi:(p)ppGpp synthase/HD superfamily hydrolase